MSKDTDDTGKSPHAFMREALGVQFRLREHRRSLIAAALQAQADALADGSGYFGAEVDRYFEALAAQSPIERPPRRAWHR
jgi:hypothetical protein